tara:strand:- start:199 stop:318 length:120 start_codon:yes stop_codon:yes gene_type:complete
MIGLPPVGRWVTFKTINKATPKPTDRGIIIKIGNEKSIN